ncbi:MAG TPA: MerC domain-containing protein [Chitinophagales bacterium]|nr:MerC domain-containing protein [Chitinophagales bacterium]
MDQPAKIHTHNIGKISTALTILCSIHCIATPVLALFLPFFNTHQSDWIELAMIIFIIVLGGTSVYHGFKSHHHKPLPSILFVSGLAILIIGFLLHGDEFQRIHTILTVVGSSLSAVGQIYNLKLSHFSHK